MSLVISSVLGCIFGIFIGLLPGIGPSLILLAVLPILNLFDLLSLFLFYFCLVSTSQYYGSVSAIIYGVPGEITSMPAVRNGHNLFLQGYGEMALAYSSTASFLASILGLGTLFFLYFNITSLLFFFKTNVIVSVYLLILCFIVLLTKNKLLSLIMLLVGLLLGKMGYDTILRQHILVPQYTELDSGIPFYPLFVGFIIIPSLVTFLKTTNSNAKFKNIEFNLTISQRLKYFFKISETGSVIRGAIIGIVSGLVPGSSYSISSNIAESIERKIGKSSLIKNLVSAEAANNSGAITVLLPLIFFAVPIIPSEAIILSIAESKGFGSTSSINFMTENLLILVSFLLAINILNWILAGYFYKNIILIYQKVSNIIYHVVIGLTLIIMFVVLSLEYQFVLGIIIFLISLFFGFVIKNIESKLVLIFAFFLSDSAINEFYRFILINF